MNETICSMLNLCLPFAQKRPLYTALFTNHTETESVRMFTFISSSPSAEHLKQLIWSKIVKLGGKEYQCADCGIVRGQVSCDWRLLVT